MVVLGPLLHIKNGNLPRGVRKVETQLPAKDLAQLQSTIAAYNKASLLDSLENAVTLYRLLRNELFKADVILQSRTEERVMEYFKEIRQQ